MKKSISVLCILSIILGCLFIPGCTASGMKFFTVETLKSSEAKFAFVHEVDVSEGDLVCEIQPDAPASITIPYKVKDKKVAAVIGAKEPAKDLSNAKISDGIKYIEKAFVKYDNLQSVDLPKSVKSVRASFKNCRNLEALDFKGELYGLKDSVEKCPSLKSVVFEDKIDGGLESGIFADCKALETLEFGADLSSYKTTELSDNASLKTLTFKGRVNNICDDAFSGCKNLNEINFGSNIGTIGNNAFEGTKSLKSLKFDVDVQKINEGAFSNSGIESIEVNSKISGIEEKAFSQLPNLKKVVWNKKAGYFNDKIFSDCKSLEVVEFKKRVKGASHRMFEGCPKLKKIIVTTMADADGQSLQYGYNMGTKRITSACEKIPYEKIKKKCEKKLGMHMPSNKRISEGSARKLSKKLNGPVFYMLYPGNCNYTKYSKKQVKKEKYIDRHHLIVNYVGDFEYSYPNTLLTKKKADRFIKGKAPLIYCLEERMGYSGPKVYTSINTSRKITKKYYYMHYRYSFWNYKTGKLVAWFTRRSGYAPFKYKLSEEGRMSYTIDGMGKKRFFLEKGGKYPQDGIAKLVFGRKKRKRL